MDRVDQLSEESQAFFDASQELAKKLYPFLMEADHNIVGFALADCLATWLAGHVLVDEKTGEVDMEATDKMRWKVFQNNIQATWRMIPLNYTEYVVPMMMKAKKAGKQ